MIDSETFDDGTKVPIVNVLHTPWADVEIDIPISVPSLTVMCIDSLSEALWNQRCKLTKVRLRRA